MKKGGDASYGKWFSLSYRRWLDRTGLHPRRVNLSANSIQQIPQETGVRGNYRSSRNFPPLTGVLWSGVCEITWH